MLKLAEYPDMLARAAAEHAPHDVAFYLRDLAALFHAYYGAERFLVDDAALARARMALLAATAQVLRNALAVLGVSAPEAMTREAAPWRRGRGMKRQRGGFVIGLDRRPVDRPGAGAGRGAVRHQDAGAVHQQGAAAHARAGQRRGRAQPQLGPQRTAGQQDHRGRGRRRLGRGDFGVERRPARRVCRHRPLGPAPVAVPSPRRRTRRRSRRGAAASAVAADPFVYFVQVGAYTRSEDAEQQRARLGRCSVRRPRSPSANRPGAPSIGCAWARSTRGKRPMPCRPACRAKGSTRRSFASRGPSDRRAEGATNVNNGRACGVEMLPLALGSGARNFRLRPESTGDVRSP